MSAEFFTAVSIAVICAAKNADLLEHDLEASAPEEVAALAAHQSKTARLAAFDDERAGRLDDVGVEASAESFVAGHDNHHRLAVGAALPRREQRMHGRVNTRRDTEQHPLHLHGVGPRIHDALLGAAQLGGGNHLHRLRDLLRVLHRAHAAPEVN